MPNPSPTIPTLEDIRLQVARRQVEARSNAVKENLALLEQLVREVKQEGDYYGQ
jgi:ligand-binding sensor domain-containing protein